MTETENKKPDLGSLIPLRIKTKINKVIEPGNLTPTSVFNTFNDNVNLEIQPLIDEIISSDPDLIGLSQTRKAVAGKIVFNYVPASDDQADIDISEFVQENLKKILTQDVLKIMLDCNFKRFSVLELNWENKDNKLQIADLTELDRNGFEFVKDKNGKLLPELKLFNADKEIYTDIPEYKALITFSAITKNRIPISLIRTLAKYFIVKFFSITDWSVFNEVFGIPFRLGKYDPETSTTTDIQRLYQAVQDIGSDSAGVISKNDEIEFPESKRQKPDTFKEIIDVCDKKEAVAILGQHNTTGVDAKGSYAALNVLNLIKEDIILSDLGIIQTAINEYLVKPLVYFNFNTEVYPSVTLTLPKKYSDKLKRDKELKDVGVKFNKGYFVKNYDLDADDFEISEGTSQPIPATKKKLYV